MLVFRKILLKYLIHDSLLFQLFLLYITGICEC